MREGLLPVMLFMMFMLNACVSPPLKQCPAGTLNLPDCPPLNAVTDKKIDVIYKLRTWISASDLKIDPIKLAAQAKIPINSAGTKIIGPSFDAALDSIAVKISMIENAQHTVDDSYYIYDTRPYRICVAWGNV